jgi:subtilisin family serine protease
LHCLLFGANLTDIQVKFYWGRFMHSRIRVVLVILVAIVFLPHLARAQTPGLPDVQQKLATLPAGSTIRVIARVAAPQAQINAVGQTNAVRQAGQQAVTALNQIGVASSNHIAGTDLVVMTVTASQLATIEQQQLFTLYQLDTPERAQLQVEVPAIHANTMHANNARGLGSLVVIVDTGVDRTHQFFGNRVVEEACFSTGDAARQVTSTCTGGATGSGSAAPCAMAGCDHGTHVAGIAAGNFAPRTGLAPDASIAAIKVFAVFGLQADCAPLGLTAPCLLTQPSDQIAALVHVRDVLLPRYAVTAVNMSLGGGNFTSYCNGDMRATFIDQLRQQGVATVVASGNSGSINGVGTPGCIENVMTVGATLNTNPASTTVAGFSNSSAGIDLLAPGDGVTSSIPNNLYASFSGTSMATPAVAGLISALRSRYYVNVDGIESALKTSGVTVTDTRNNIQRPRTDALAAYNALEAMRPAGEFIWMKDGWNDSGLEPDPAMAGQPMSQSPFIWVRTQDDGSAPANHYQHQNPEFGQPNYIYVKVLNTGRTSGTGTLSIFVSNASPNPNVAAAWNRLVDTSLTIPPRQEAVYKFPWLNVPAPGHYCLLAKWTPPGGSTSLQFNNIDAAVRSSNDLIWKNINIVDLQANTAINTKFEWRKGATGDQSNFGIEVKGSRARNSLLRVRLHKRLASLLREEPTLATVTFEEEGDFVDTLIALSDGVYYFPLPDNVVPPTVEVPLTFRKIENVRERIAVTVFQVRDIAEHKRNGAGMIGAVTYQVSQ